MTPVMKRPMLRKCARTAECVELRVGPGKKRVEKQASRRENVYAFEYRLLFTLDLAVS